jgi:hypothetical protein
MQKLQLEGRIATREEIEDEGLVRAIKNGETKEYIDTKKFVAKLRKQ